MPFPRGAKGSAKASSKGSAGRDAEQDLAVCGLCLQSVEDEEHIVGTCSVCGTRAFHVECTRQFVFRELKAVKDRRVQDRGQMWATNHPEKVFARNSHIPQRPPRCPGPPGSAAGACSGFVESADLVKPQKAAAEEVAEAPAAPAAPAARPARKALPERPATAAAAPAPPQNPRKAAGLARMPLAAPQAQLGGSAGLSRATSSTSVASSQKTFAQEQLEAQRRAVAAARAQLAAQRGGGGAGGGSGAGASRPLASQSQRSGGPLQRASSHLSGSASASSWRPSSSAAWSAGDEDEAWEAGSGGSEPQPATPPAAPVRAPTPDWTAEAWPGLGCASAGPDSNAGGNSGRLHSPVAMPAQGDSWAPAAAPASDPQLAGTIFAAQPCPPSPVGPGAVGSPPLSPLSQQPLRFAPAAPLSAGASLGGSPTSAGSHGAQSDWSGFMEWKQRLATGSAAPSPAGASEAGSASSHAYDVGSLAAALRAQQAQLQNQWAAASASAAAAGWAAPAAPTAPAAALLPAAPPSYHLAAQQGLAGSDEEVDALLAIMGIA